jgi:glycosyltransferase involved in cell wall biosynthesis
MNSAVQLMIVMATFNGEAYLAEQIDSIRKQTFTDWLLVIRDDGSRDATQEILKRYARMDPRIVLLEDDLGNLGAKGCFSRLLLHAVDAGAPYIACSDQDDVWLPEKLEHAIRRIRKLESELGTGTPVLVHTDLEVVDETLRPLSPSFMQYENIGKSNNPPVTTLLVQNHVVGCTMLANRALIDLAMPVPAGARMHDWWLALCAKLVGVLDYVSLADIKYRQHRANTLGVSGFALVFQVFRRTWWEKLAKWRRLHQHIMSQCSALQHWAGEDRVASGLTVEGRRGMEAISCFGQPGIVRALLCAHRHAVRGQNLPATVLFYILMWRRAPLTRS